MARRNTRPDFEKNSENAVAFLKQNAAKNSEIDKPRTLASNTTPAGKAAQSATNTFALLQEEKERNKLLVTENESLKKAQEELMLKGASIEMIPLKDIDPKPIFHNRSPESFEEEETKLVLDDIAENGNDSPILLRPHSNANSSFKYEIVFGECRYRGCVQGNRESIRAGVRDISDSELATARLKENKVRSAPWAYDIGKAMHEMISSGALSSQVALARNSGYSQGTVSKYINLYTFSTTDDHKHQLILDFFDNYAKSMTILGYEKIAKVIRNKQNMEYIYTNLEKLMDVHMTDAHRIELLSSFMLFDRAIDILEHQDIKDGEELLSIAKKSIEKERIEIELENEARSNITYQDLDKPQPKRKTNFKDVISGGQTFKIGYHADHPSRINKIEFSEENQFVAQYISDHLEEIVRDARKVVLDLGSEG